MPDRADRPVASATPETRPATLRGDRATVIGHRGASGYRPEHTRDAYELAFALGADAVEPDVEAARDGVLVIRHENEISGTTDVASHPAFADRRTTKEVDGEAVTGWFTEDFTWAELATLRARERLPKVRPASARFDGMLPILRLDELIELVERASERHRRELGLVVEIKHARYLAERGIPLGALTAEALAGTASRARTVVESFEASVLGEVRSTGLDARTVYLMDHKGTAADLVGRDGATPYAAQLSARGLPAIAASGVDGVSLSVRWLAGGASGSGLSTPGSAEAAAAPTPTGESPESLVARVHAAGLECWTWTLRAENRYLPESRRIGADRAAPGDWPAEFRRILDLGVDGVFADQPDLAVFARDRLG